MIGSHHFGPIGRFGPQQQQQQQQQANSNSNSNSNQEQNLIQQNNSNKQQHSIIDTDDIDHTVINSTQQQTNLATQLQLQRQQLSPLTTSGLMTATTTMNTIATDDLASTYGYHIYDQILAPQAPPVGCYGAAHTQHQHQQQLNGGGNAMTTTVHDQAMSQYESNYRQLIDKFGLHNVIGNNNNSASTMGANNSNNSMCSKCVSTIHMPYTDYHTGVNGHRNHHHHHTNGTSKSATRNQRHQCQMACCAAAELVGSMCHANTTHKSRSSLCQANGGGTARGVSSKSTFPWPLIGARSSSSPSSATSATSTSGANYNHLHHHHHHHHHGITTTSAMSSTAGPESSITHEHSFWPWSLSWLSWLISCIFSASSRANNSGVPNGNAPSAITKHHQTSSSRLRRVGVVRAILVMLLLALAITLIVCLVSSVRVANNNGNNNNNNNQINSPIKSSLSSSSSSFSSSSSSSSQRPISSDLNVATHHRPSLSPVLAPHQSRQPTRAPSMASQQQQQQQQSSSETATVSTLHLPMRIHSSSDRNVPLSSSSSQSSNPSGTSANSATSVMLDNSMSIPIAPIEQQQQQQQQQTDSTILNDNNNKDEVITSRLVIGEFVITSQNYSTSIASPRSTLAENIVKLMDQIFLANEMRASYLRTEITAISPATSANGGILVEFRVILSHSIEAAAPQVGYSLHESLEKSNRKLAGQPSLLVDIRSIRFSAVPDKDLVQGIVPSDLVPPDFRQQQQQEPSINDRPFVQQQQPTEQHHRPQVVWSEWSKWSSCHDKNAKCDPMRIHSRLRKCISQVSGNEVPIDECRHRYGPHELSIEISDCARECTSNADSSMSSLSPTSSSVSNSNKLTAAPLPVASGQQAPSSQSTSSSSINGDSLATSSETNPATVTSASAIVDDVLTNGQQQQQQQSNTTTGINQQQQQTDVNDDNNNSSNSLGSFVPGKPTLLNPATPVTAPTATVVATVTGGTNNNNAAQPTLNKFSSPSNVVCSNCTSDEICLMPIRSKVAFCATIKDAQDSTGCGGWCNGDNQLCQALSPTTYRCIHDSECLPNEWQCNNSACIPESRRCDGHPNCYDSSDELNCPNTNS